MRKIYYISFVFLLSIAYLSCKKYEQLPLNQYGDAEVFDSTDVTGTLALQFLNNIYSELPRPGALRIGSTGVLDAATDDAASSTINATVETLSTGKFGIAGNADDAWIQNYRGIRKVNIFLSKIEVVPVTSATKSYWKAEARFLRALFYFELIKRYGGVPLLSDQVFGLYDNLDIPRKSFDECVTYIVSECDQLKPLLRPDPVVAADLGRATAGAAYALKSRVLLYAASPLHNPSGNTAKWQAAATAAKDLISLNKFSLVSSFLNVFTTRSNTEVIFAFQRGKTDDLERAHAPVGYLVPNASAGHISPSQNLVDAFPSANGRAINDPGNTTYNPASPYANRDPRLALTVFTNGSMWLNRAVETFEGGLDKPGGSIRQTRTGYYMRKFLANMSTSTAYSTQDHNYTIFRYAEILLNYAEAINEAGVGTQQTEAFNQLKAIRLRAGIAAGSTAGYQHGLKTNMTQAELREAIRLERRIEMAFEEQRYWDIRRWKIAEAVINNQPLKAVTITKDAGTGTFTFTPATVYTMTFLPKMYLYPIPLTEMLANKKLVQNPGW
jgi:hypothetical protein